MLEILLLYLVVFGIFNFLVIVLFKCGALSNMIFFYRGIALIGVCALVTAGTFLMLHYRTGEWRIESIIAATVVAVSAQLAFFVTVPVTLDRSVSVFLLGRVDSHREGISKEDLTSEFLSEYVHKQDAIGRRIFEQSASGNIKVSKGVIKLTIRGRIFLSLAGAIKNVYGI